MVILRLRGHEESYQYIGAVYALKKKSHSEIMTKSRRVHTHQTQTSDQAHNSLETLHLINEYI